MVEDALCDILRKRASHALAQCGNESGSDSTAIIPLMSAAGNVMGGDLYAVNPPGRPVAGDRPPRSRRRSRSTAR